MPWELCHGQNEHWVCDEIGDTNYWTKNDDKKKKRRKRLKTEYHSVWIPTIIPNRFIQSKEYHKYVFMYREIYDWMRYK